MEEDLDLYGDLDPFFPVEPASSLFRLQDDSSQAQIVKELEDTKETNGKLSAQNNALRKNISCLYKTARLELQRKDSVIKSLQQRLHVLEVKVHGAQSQGRRVNSPQVMLHVPPKLPTSDECNYIQCERKMEGEKRNGLDKPDKQSVVICAELGESQRNGTRSESQRNDTKSQLVRRSEGLIMVDTMVQDRLEVSVSQEQTFVNGTMNRRKSHTCAIGVGVKQSGTSVSSQTRSSDKENCPIHRDRQTEREELGLGGRSQDVWRSRRRESQVDGSHSHSRGCSRESRSSKREKGSGRRRRRSRGLVSSVGERREGALQPGRRSKRRHSHDKKDRVLKKARAEPAEAAGVDIERSRRKSSPEVRQWSHTSSLVGEEKEEVCNDVSNGDAYQEESGKDPRQEGHRGECIGSNTEPSHEEWRWNTSREDLDRESVTTGEHLPSRDIEAISESDSEEEPCTPMELTIVVEPESDFHYVSEDTESLKTDIPSGIAPLPLPQDRELATISMLPQESAVDVGALTSLGTESLPLLTSLGTESLPLLSPLRETYSGNHASVLNNGEKFLNREDQSSTGDDGSAAVSERTSSLESHPEISIHLRFPRPLFQESDSSDDILMILPFPSEDIIPLSPLPPSPSPRDYSTSMVPHSDSFLPYCSGSLSLHTSSTTTGEEVISEDDGKTLIVIELNDGASHSCRSSKEPSPCNSSQPPSTGSRSCRSSSPCDSSRPPSTGSHSCRSSKEPSPCNSFRPPSTAVYSTGSEIEEGELISEDEDKASTTSSSTCSKTSANSAPPMQEGNRSCKLLKTSRKTERSCYRNLSSKELVDHTHRRPSSERTVIGTLRSHKEDSRRQPALKKPTCRSHDSEGYRTQTLCDSEGYGLQRSRDSKGRSHYLKGYKTQKSHDLEEYTTQRSHDPECHRAPIGHRREALHSSRGHHLPHARVHDYDPKLLRH